MSQQDTRTSPFLRNCWYVAAWNYELRGDAPIAVTVIGEPITLFRQAGGRIVAFEDRCPHRHAPLSMGRVEGDELRCMYHGLRFAADGRCTHVPGTNRIPTNTAVRVYPVVERDSWLWVWMGDPARASEDLIPRAFGLDDSRWTMRAGQLNYRADYQLLNDNLCDLSHVDFVHETTLRRASGGGWSDEVPHISAHARGLRVTRWFVAKPASPTNPALVDTWSTYDFLVPGIFTMENRSYPHGMAEECGLQAPSAKPATYRVEQQAVTPMTQDRTRYFYATGFDAANLPSKLLEGIFQMVGDAFIEDHRMIEAQQRVWDQTPADRQKVYVPQDKGPYLMRQLLARLIKEEQR
jgi:nitrite reductase/ring-hydroxylating ferredoxin subunit